MKTLILLGVIASTAYGIPSADVSRQASTVSVAKNNSMVLMSFVDRVNVALADATKQGKYDTQLEYKDTQYTLVYALAKKLEDKGYQVNIDRARRVISISWGK